MRARRRSEQVGSVDDGRDGLLESVTVSDAFYRVRVRVHWADTDAAGIVWFGHFLRYFETAEDELFRALGHPRTRLIETFDIFLPRVEVTCRFRAPARADDELEVGIGVEMVNERRVAYRFEVRQRETGRLLAEGSYRVACVKQSTFEPVEFPPAFRELLARVPQLIARQRSGSDGPPESSPR